MKILLILLFLFLKTASGQKITYNAKIEKVNKIEITEGRATIKHADTVLVNIYISNTAPIFLSDYNRIQDTSGRYITVLNFINPKSTTYFGVNIKLKFDKPIDSIYWDYSTYAANGSKQCEDNMMECRFTYASVESNNGIQVYLLSKYKIGIDIEGLMGILKD